jgi:hypothetical protein
MAARPDDIFLGILLGLTLDHFFAEYRWNDAHSDFEWVEVNDAVLK